VGDILFRRVGEHHANGSGQRTYTVLLSMVAHTLAIAIGVMVPLFATDRLLPARAAIAVFSVRPPLPPAPPAPAPARPSTEPPQPATPSPPVVAPNSIVPERPHPPAVPFAGIDVNDGLVTGADFVAAAPPPAAPPPVSEPKPLRPGMGISAPVKTKDVLPAYPSIARAAHVEGVVIIEATIDAAGKVREARILRSIPLLDAAALDAVRQWEYTPSRLNGNPVAVVLTVTVRFRLQ
jgi:protein TonB